MKAFRLSLKSTWTNLSTDTEIAVATTIKFRLLKNFSKTSQTDAGLLLLGIILYT